MKYAVFAVILAAGPACADQYTAVMTTFARDSIVGWAEAPVLIEEIVAQNAEHAGLSQADIDEMDRQWRNQVGQGNRPIVEPVLSNPAADYLRQIVEESGGIVTEVFIMDNRGLNVAASDPTSDYWQGDEAKFTETYGKGASALHIGDIEFDDSTQSYQGQVSVPVMGPGGAVIGAMTVGLNAEMLF